MEEYERPHFDIPELSAPTGKFDFPGGWIAWNESGGEAEFFKDVPLSRWTGKGGIPEILIGAIAARLGLWEPPHFTDEELIELIRSHNAQTHRP